MSPRDDHSLPVQMEDLPIDGSPSQMIIGTTPPPLTSSGPRRETPAWRIPAAIFIGAASIAIIVALAAGLSGGDRSANELQVAGWVAEQGFSTVEAIFDPESPQSKAVKFMTQGQAVPTENESENSFKWMERYVLSVFFYATNGDNWSTLLDTGFNDPEKKTCDWHVRIELTTGATIPFGASCDANGRVDAIQIFRFLLSGTLPTELGLLTDMQFLVLPQNFIGSTIPDELGNWSILKNFIMQDNLIKGTLPDSFRSFGELTNFDCHRCDLEGPIPDWISQWSSLTRFTLTENKLTGAIPDSFSVLTNLEFIALDDNFLTGDLATLEDMTKLEEVYLEQNGFSQFIDARFLNRLTSLSALDISDNAFFGPVPVHLMALESLIIMDVHDNALTSFPDNISQFTKVQFLSIHDNPITDSAFPNTASHLTDLKHLDITSTKFSGKMPSLLGDLQDIYYLFMADTDFEPGPIPDSYQQLQDLRDFSLKSSGRNGTIPTWFQDMEGLLLLDLDDNDLTGTLPRQLAGIQSLRYLQLNRNKLDGEIPTEFHTASQIQVLLLDHNSLTGDLNPYCENANIVWGATADCGGDVPQVNCTCCISCCDDNDPEPCNEYDRLAQYDPEWEDGYMRNGISDFDFTTDFNFTRL